MRVGQGLVAVAVVMMLASSVAWAEVPRSLTMANALETALFEDAADGKLDNHSMMDAAFIASGLPDQEALDDFRGTFDDLVDDLREETAGLESNYDRARAAFKFLHGRIFKRYGLRTVDMVSLFSRGEYNCVSATVLYNSVLDELDITSHGVLVPSHAYSLVRVGGRDVEVETTSPGGFDPARTEDEYRKLLEQYRLTGALYETVDGKKVARTSLVKEVEGRKNMVDNLTMVAVIYSNIAAARVSDGDMQSALALFMKASALARGDEFFLKSRDALLNNSIVDQIEDGEYGRALATAREARKLPFLSPDFLDRLDRWSVHAWSKIAMAKEEDGQYRESVATYVAGLREFPSSRVLLHNRKASLVSWALAHLAAGQFQEAGTVTLATLKLYPSDSVARRNYLASVQKYVRSLRENDSAHAQKVAEFALGQARALLPGEPQSYLVLQLELEVGFVFFLREDYEAAAGHFAHGLGQKDEVYARNYSAAQVNLTGRLLRAGKTGEAFDKSLAAIELLGKSATAKMEAAFWTAAVHQANELSGKSRPKAAIGALTRRPLETLIASSDREVMTACGKHLSTLLLGAERMKECEQVLEKLSAPLDHPDWLEERIIECRE